MSNRHFIYKKQYACDANSAIINVCGYGQNQDDCHIRGTSTWIGATFDCTAVNPLVFDADAKPQDHASKTLTTDCGTSGLLSGLCLSGENDDCGVDNIGQHTVEYCHPLTSNAFRSDGQPSWESVTYESDNYNITNVAGTGAVSCKPGYVATAVCNGAGNFDDCHTYDDVPASVAERSYTFMKCGKLREGQDTLVSAMTPLVV